MKAFYAECRGKLVKIGDVAERPDGSLVVVFSEPPPPTGIIYDPLEVTRPKPPTDRSRFKLTFSFCPKCASPVAKHAKQADGPGRPRHAMLAFGEDCPRCHGSRV